MRKGDLNYSDFVNKHECVSCVCNPQPKPYPCCCVGTTGPQGPIGPTGPTGPFLSSYIEAVGDTQEIARGENVVFDIDEEYLDIVGGDIEVDETGTVFTINRPGLYHVEWSLNLQSGEAPVLVCLLENGVPSSPLSHSTTTGNYSSGALINVEEGDIPYTISLHNFGGPITIENPATYGNSSASIRILRFADGAAQ